ncbi:MAG: hypothetical protein HYU29_05755 [Chloroflexi bacterium]|nr:hypothetical protein [Chloroflexota bacterium]
MKLVISVFLVLAFAAFMDVVSDAQAKHQAIDLGHGWRIGGYWNKYTKEGGGFSGYEGPLLILGYNYAEESYAAPPNPSELGFWWALDTNSDGLMQMTLQSRTPAGKHHRWLQFRTDPTGNYAAWGFRGRLFRFVNYSGEYNIFEIDEDARTIRINPAPGYTWPSYGLQFMAKRPDGTPVTATLRLEDSGDLVVFNERGRKVLWSTPPVFTPSGDPPPEPWEIEAGHYDPLRQMWR